MYAVAFISGVRSTANVTMDARVYVPSIYHARTLVSKHFTLMLFRALVYPERCNCKPAVIPS